MREPVPGKVKKRLARAIGAARACRIYVACVKKTIRLARGPRLPIYFFCAPAGSVERTRNFFRIRAPIFPQRGRSLGDRMRSAFQTLLRNSSAAMLIGTDSPTLSPNFLKEAARYLESNDLVLGPALDGGYYLIGMGRAGFKKGARQLFSRVHWGGRDVFQTTLARAGRLNLRTAILHPWFDIDTAADLRRAGFC